MFLVFILENTKYQSYTAEAERGQADLGRSVADQLGMAVGRLGLPSLGSLCEESRILHSTTPGLYLQGRTFPAFISWNLSLPAIICLNLCSSCGLC